MQRYFINELALKGDLVYITGQDAFHITKVMRFKEADQIYVSVNEKSFLCEIISLCTEEVKARIIKELESNELKIKVTLLQGLVKKEKIEEIIKRNTELGAYEYMIVNMERSNIKMSMDDLNKKKERFDLIIKEAAEQSQRSLKPRISFYNKLKDIDYSGFDQVFICYEKTDLSDNLKNTLNKEFNNILVVIGPEGGISESEVKFFLDLPNVSFVSLGKRILRTETAASYFLSVVSYYYEY